MSFQRPRLFLALLLCVVLVAAGTTDILKDRGVIDLIRAYNTAAIEAASAGEWKTMMEERFNKPENKFPQNYFLSLDFENEPGDCLLNTYDWPNPKTTPYNGQFNKFLKEGKLDVAEIKKSCLDGGDNNNIIKFQKKLLSNIFDHYNLKSNKNNENESENQESYSIKFNIVEEFEDCSSENLSKAMEMLRGNADKKVSVILGDIPMLDPYSNNGIFGCSTYGSDIGVYEYLGNVDNSWKNQGSIQETLKYIMEGDNQAIFVIREKSKASRYTSFIPNDKIKIMTADNYNDFNNNSTMYCPDSGSCFLLDETLVLMELSGFNSNSFTHKFFNVPSYNYGPLFPFAGFVQGYGNSQLTLALNTAIDYFYDINATESDSNGNKRYSLLEMNCDKAICNFVFDVYKLIDGKCKKVTISETDKAEGFTMCLNQLQRTWVETYYPLLITDNVNGIKNYSKILIPNFGIPKTSGFKSVSKNGVTTYGKLNYAIVSGSLRMSVGPRFYGVNTPDSFTSNVINQLGSYFGESYGRNVKFVEVYDSFKDEDRARCILSGQTPTAKKYDLVKPAADFVAGPVLTANYYDADYTIDLIDSFYVHVKKGQLSEENNRPIASTSTIVKDGSSSNDYNLSTEEVKLRSLLISTNGDNDLMYPYVMSVWWHSYLNGSFKLINSNYTFTAKDEHDKKGINLKVSFDYNDIEYVKPTDEIARSFSTTAIILGAIGGAVGIALFILHGFGVDRPKFVEEKANYFQQINDTKEVMNAAPLVSGAIEAFEG